MLQSSRMDTKPLYSNVLQGHNYSLFFLCISNMSPCEWQAGKNCQKKNWQIYSKQPFFLLGISLAPHANDTDNNIKNPLILIQGFLCVRHCYSTAMCVREGNGTSLQYSCLENPMEGGAWWAPVHGSQRVRHDWVTSLSLFTFMHWRRTWQPTPVFLSGETQGRQSLVGCPSMGSHRVGHGWSDLAAAAATTFI